MTVGRSNLKPKTRGTNTENKSKKISYLLPVNWSTTDYGERNET